MAQAPSPPSSAASSKSSKGWIKNISSIASCVYFFLIILQIPLFSFCSESSMLVRNKVLAGSYFSVAGAFVGILKRGRMSMFGMLLVLWGLVKEGILGKPVDTHPTKAVFLYPTMLIGVVAAFSSVKYNMKKAATRSAPAARPIAKPLQSSSKPKLK